MTEALQEDTQYLHDGTIDDFAIDDSDPTGVQTADEDQTVETQLIKELMKYLDEAEVEHNTFDIIDLTEQAKMTPTQQIAVHKCVVQHLRNIRNEIKNRVKEN